ncbi:type II CAAX prenyl endopeptidase Rce1 family protein [Metaclostridioides mangenotii]
MKHNFFYFIEAALITPFIEELIFRGIFFNITFNLLDMEDKVIKNCNYN